MIRMTMIMEMRKLMMMVVGRRRGIMWEFMVQCTSCRSVNRATGRFTFGTIKC